MNTPEREFEKYWDSVGREFADEYCGGADGYLKAMANQAFYRGRLSMIDELTEKQEAEDALGS